MGGRTGSGVGTRRNLADDRATHERSEDRRYAFAVTRGAKWHRLSTANWHPKARGRCLDAATVRRMLAPDVPGRRETCVAQDLLGDADGDGASHGRQYAVDRGWTGTFPEELVANPLKVARLQLIPQENRRVGSEQRGCPFETSGGLLLAPGKAEATLRCPRGLHDTYKVLTAVFMSIDPVARSRSARTIPPRPPK